MVQIQLTLVGWLSVFMMQFKQVAPSSVQVLVFGNSYRKLELFKRMVFTNLLPFKTVSPP